MGMGRVLQVEPAAESLAGAREDQAAHLRIAIGVGERVRERIEHLEADRVQPFRTVEREDSDAVAELVEQVGHGAGPDTPCAPEQPLAPLPAPAGRGTRRARCVRLAAPSSMPSFWTPATRSSRSTTRWCARC